VLQGTLEVALLRDRSPGEYKAILNQAATEAGQMGNLIGNLLALARIQSDQETLTLESLDLRAVVWDAVEGIRPLAERKGQLLDVAAGGELLVRGDRLKLRQLIANLLDNAVTYTPEGGAIRIVVHAERGHAAVEVRDTGPGIPAQHLPHLFEPFYRVDTARGDGAEHVGLGLALAQWIARAHGGHIQVESQPGVGSAFTLVLPLVPRRTRMQAESNSAIGPPGSETTHA
jgi:two-component system, OmpR family, sensor kinase